MNEQLICNRCILDSSVPGVYFDEKGICNHCKLHDKLENQYASNESNRNHFTQLLEEIQSKGKKRKYDCVVGLSGGIDSTYCLYTVKKLGLRPLALHVDNGWVSESARNNITKAVRTLNVDLKTITLNWKQLKAYYRACLKASVPETCLPCEVGIVSSLYEAAAEENVNYIVLGTSFRTEGINPLRWHYVDGAYFEDIIRRFGDIDIGTRDFNKLRMLDLFNYIFLRRIRTIQLPLYVEWRNEHILKTLEEELDWEYGGRQHFDCLYKPFGSYIEREKFKRDPRKITLSALVRSEEITRDEALNMLEEDTYFENKKCVEYCIQKLEITHEELQDILSSEPKNFLHYHTYYSIFSRLRLPVKVCCKLNLIPETLYEKFFEVV